MWEREFSEEMLFESDSIIVYIPNGELKVEFFREMIALGIEWAGGEQMGEKDAEKPYKAFRIVCKSRERGIFVLKRGDKIEYESDDYDFCIRCTYVGRPCDIECSTDKEFLAFLGVPGGEGKS